MSLFYREICFLDHFLLLRLAAIFFLQRLEAPVMKPLSLILSTPLCALFCLGVPADADAALIGYYTFENSANDVSGNGNHGTYSATAPVFTTSGYSGGAYRFGAGGANTFISVPININPAVLPQLTMGAWVKAEVADAVIRGVISHDDGNFDRHIGVDTRVGDGSVASWCAFNGLGGAFNGHCIGGVVANEWTFLAASYDQTTGAAAFMVNDVYFEYAAGEFLGSSVLTTTTIGRNPNFDSPFVGVIDNVFFFNEYLGQGNLNDIRLTGVSVPEPHTLALLSLAAVGLCFGRRRPR